MPCKVCRLMRKAKFLVCKVSRRSFGVPSQEDINILHHKLVFLCLIRLLAIVWENMITINGLLRKI